MYLRILKNDFKKNPGSNLAILFFIMLSAGIAAAVFLMLTQLFTSISSLYEKAMPPHFLQLHKGGLNQKEIDTFNEEYPGITDWQTVSMISTYGSELMIEGKQSFTLADCQLDIGLVKQNEGLDLLLDEERNRVQLKEGEIGVPVILLEQYQIALGDNIRLSYEGGERTFKVAAFVHDAQMNSTLCSSTRFLLSDGDFQELSGNTGEIEYIIEAWFKDTSMASAYQSAYEQAGLPQNGQAVTYSIIFLLSAMTDMITAMVFLLIGILLILMALICMKYTVMASLEEDLEEIGTMKALGIPYGSIRGLYLGKMRILLVTGAVLGYVFVLTGAGFFTGRMGRTFGKQPVSVMALCLSMAACMLVSMIFIQYFKGIIKRVKKVTVMEALVEQKGLGKKKKVKDELHFTERIPVNIFFGLHELRQNLSGYSIVFLIMMIMTFLVLVPQNLVSTMKAKDFITYMGSGVHDAMIEVEQGKGVEERWSHLMDMLKREEGVTLQSVRRVKVAARDAKDELVNLHIDTGANCGKGLNYLNGKAPAGEHEIALSVLLAEELEKVKGEELVLMIDGKREAFNICGVYQDVTSGGMTAKASYGFPEAETEQYAIYVDIEEGLDKEKLVFKWKEQAGAGHNIEFMEGFVEQILGGVVSQIQRLSVGAFGTAILLIFLVISLFMKLRIAGESSQIAYKRAVGIAVKDVRFQEFYPVFIISCIGVIIGTVLANLCGDLLAGGFFSLLGIGIQRIEFTLQPWMSWLFVPMFLIILAAVSEWCCGRQIKKIRAVDYVND